MESAASWSHGAIPPRWRKHWKGRSPTRLCATGSGGRAGRAQESSPGRRYYRGSWHCSVSWPRGWADCAPPEPGEIRGRRLGCDPIGVEFGDETSIAGVLYRHGRPRGLAYTHALDANVHGRLMNRR